MPVFLGHGGQSVSSLPEESAGEEVGTRSRDLEETKRKADASAETLDSQRHENDRSDGKESEEKGIIRKTSVVDILRRNVGSSKAPFASDNNADLELEFEKVDSASPEPDRGSSVGNAGEESDSKSSDFSSSLKLEDFELSDSEGDAESDSKAGGGGWQSKEHVYCTVYCIANDDYRKPPGSPGDLGDGAPSVLPDLPPTDSPDPEPYTLSDLVDSTELSSLHSTVSALLTCRICLDDGRIRPLHCCQMAVCEQCLKTYISSQVQCSKCQFVWCFKCHAPWHEGLKCREYRKGDKLLRHWASVIEHGQRNAQKCPRCKIHIQRTEGCDHMTCTQCNTNFCYRCGEKYRHLRFFGDHTSNLSVFGCKYRYLPDKPHLRRLVRGSVCVSKVLVAPVVIVLVVIVGALALVIGLFAFPIYYICKKRRKHSNGSGRWLC
ncbi:probable E3 ubiquitin-protein ligase RNF217 isoform X2 [Pygocentrus nattereri]|uniref:probable E3 ubiquitin-protein ligase RNF217 isoform X2 n=1 Tax=Pygocentrus nattereri TaxID=42514 RepID=UPI001890ED93|nr:probable E3 ubiquitin-protein ligase RNF217 isoform X2 [Pygocentrus nattereri]